MDGVGFEFNDNIITYKHHCIRRTIVIGDGLSANDILYMILY